MSFWKGVWAGISKACRRVGRIRPHLTPSHVDNLTEAVKSSDLTGSIQPPPLRIGTLLLTPEKVRELIQATQTGDHLKSLLVQDERAAAQRKKEEAMARLLSLEDPTLRDSDFRDAQNRDEPAFLASQFHSGMGSYNNRMWDAQRRMDYFWNFTPMIEAAMAGLTQEDLADLALHAMSAKVRSSAAERIRDPSTAARVFRETQDATVRSWTRPQPPGSTPRPKAGRANLRRRR